MMRYSTLKKFLKQISTELLHHDEQHDSWEIQGKCVILDYNYIFLKLYLTMLVFNIIIIKYVGQTCLNSRCKNIFIQRCSRSCVSNGYKCSQCKIVMPLNQIMRCLYGTLSCQNFYFFGVFFKLQICQNKMVSYILTNPHFIL